MYGSGRNDHNAVFIELLLKLRKTRGWKASENLDVYPILSAKNKLIFFQLADFNRRRKVYPHGITRNGPITPELSDETVMSRVFIPTNTANLES